MKSPIASGNARRNSALRISFALICCVGQTALAQNPNKDKISYQTRIFTPAGAPFNSGATPTPIILRIYDQANPPPGTQPLHTTQLSEYVDDGYAPLTMQDAANPTTPLNDIFKNHPNLYVEMEVAGQKLSPLTPLQSVPYAFHANYAVTAGNADNVAQKAITPATITINGIQVFDPAAGLNATSIKIGGSTIVDAAKNISIASLDLGGNDVIEPDGDIVIRKSPGSPQLQFDNQTGVAGIDASIVLTSDDDLRISSANLTVSELIGTDKGIYSPFIEIRELLGTGLPAMQFSNLGTPGGQSDARLELSTDDELTLSGANLKLFGSNLIVTGGITAGATRSGFVEIEDALTPGIDFTLTPGDVGPGDYSARLIMTGQDSMNLLDSNLIVDGTVTANAFNPTPSDSRLKQNVTPMTDALDKLLSLQGVRFEWTKMAKSELRLPDGDQLGFVAQALDRVVPEAVSHPKNEDDFYRAKYETLIPVIVEGVKEYVSRTDAQLAAKTAENIIQAKRIDDLEAKLAALAERLATLEQR